MLLVTLVVNSWLLAGEFGGSQKLYADFGVHRAGGEEVDALNPHAVQG